MKKNIIMKLLVFFVYISVFSDCFFVNCANGRRYARQTKREIRYLAHLDTVDFIKHFGYPCESHKVVTDDGYILTMHRVPSGRNVNDVNVDNRIVENKTKPVVFLQHGIFSYSGDWFVSGPEKALGFILADQGYDVWLGNARGNKHSRSHIMYHPDLDSQFWDFSFHEIGVYDIPAMIDYTLNSTQEERLFYIGHSQGTTVYFTLLSERPEYNDKIVAQFSLSPIVFMSNVHGLILKFLVLFDKVIEFGADLLNINELNHEHPIFSVFFYKFCSSKFIDKLCIKEIFSLAGANKKQFNETLLPIILANFPAGSSIKQLKHFSQEIRSGQFEQYDYGYKENQLMYNDFNPPKYDLLNSKAPVYLFCSNNDNLSSLKDVKKLYWSLPEGRKFIWKVKDPNWNHVDYIWGIDAKKYVYDIILNAMKSYVTT